MWYSASLLFQSVHNKCSTPNDVWELQIVIIQAPSADAALKIANEIGKQREHEYVSATGGLGMLGVPSNRIVDRIVRKY